MKRTLQTILLTLAAAGLCAAQGPHGYGRGAGTASASPLDMAKVQTVSGSVTAVNIGYGMQYPSIAIGKVQIKIAPVWYLLENDFEIKTGDVLNVQAAPSTSSTDPYLYAISIANTAASQQIVLRDSLGRPLWTASQGGGPAGNGPAGYGQGSCPVSSITATASGTVEQIASGVGIQMPTLTLKLASGTLLTFRLGPERILLASDFELKAGDQVTVTYATSIATGELIALSITNAAGQTIVLRDEAGRPGWR